MRDYQPIQCGDYDILEIVCMDRYEIELHFDAGITAGIADRLETRSGEEFLVIRKSDGTIEKVRVDRLQKLTVQTRPARFAAHKFANDIPAL